MGNNQNNNKKKPYVYNGQEYDNYYDWVDAVDRGISGKSEQEQKTEQAKVAAMENQSFKQASQGKDSYVNPTTPIEEYDPIISAEYQDAISAIEGVNGNKPLGNMSFTAQLQNLYNQIVNREKFTFDVNSDAMYQQMKDSYIAQGKLAAEDVMGQAAAMNGGYGSSYGQSVGQQTYQGYMKQLNDNIPDLYSMALDRYNQEGQDMIDRASVLEGLAAEEYADFVAKLSRGENVTEEEMAAVGLTQEEVDYMYEELSKPTPEKLEHVGAMSTETLVEKLNGYNALGDNTGLETFLDDCVAANRLTQVQADEYYKRYRVPEEGEKGFVAPSDDTENTKDAFVASGNLHNKTGSLKEYADYGNNFTIYDAENKDDLWVESGGEVKDKNTLKAMKEFVNDRSRGMTDNDIFSYNGKLYIMHSGRFFVIKARNKYQADYDRALEMATNG